MLQYQAWWWDMTKPDITKACMEWIADFRDAMRPRHTEGSFINFPDYDLVKPDVPDHRKKLLSYYYAGNLTDRSPSSTSTTRRTRSTSRWGFRRVEAGPTPYPSRGTSSRCDLGFSWISPDFPPVIRPARPSSSACESMLEVRVTHISLAMRYRVFILAAIAAALLLSHDVRAGLWNRAGRVRVDSVSSLPGGLGWLPELPDHPKNPATPAKVELGRQLFEDARLSGDESLSCASCHPREMGYADSMRFSEGAGGQPMPRHTPTLLNVAYYRYINWDGKFANVSELVLGVLANPRNMNMQDENVLIARLEAVPEYRAEFRDVFGGPPTRQRVALAIDAYVRRLTTPNSPFDVYAAGDPKALTDAQKRGLVLFVGKADCAMCHRGPNFADDQFHALGITGTDTGRFKVTGVEADRDAFKTPTLRNVGMTAPYMHDGSMSTLREVIDFYNAGGGGQRPKSPLLRKLDLTEREKADLEAFIESLTGTVEKMVTQTAVK
jgi:cytochrome c peroxidase